MQYLVGEGHDEPLIDLVAIDPQPRCEGLKASRESFAASGVVVREGPYAELIFDVIESQSQYETMLAQFGLDALVSANVTVTLPNALYTSTRFNGRAVRPLASETVRHESYFIRNVRIVIRDLELAS